ncbi:MAG: hypothetical protein JO184_08545 [Gammaproteobacteria bacterium]|nr:hypothetical protein [Gammaproteobacteria bacterium]
MAPAESGDNAFPSAQTGDTATDLITIEDLALQAGVSTRHARRWGQQGRFPTQQIVVDKHLRLMVPREPAERFLRQRQAELAEAADKTAVMPEDIVRDKAPSADLTQDVPADHSPIEAPAPAMSPDIMEELRLEIAALRAELRSKQAMSPVVSLVPAPPDRPGPHDDHGLVSVRDLLEEHRQLVLRYGALRDRFRRERKHAKMFKGARQLALSEGEARQEAELKAQQAADKARAAIEAAEQAQRQLEAAQELAAHMTEAAQSEAAEEARRRSRLEEELRATQERLADLEAQRRQEQQKQTAVRVPWWRRVLGGGTARA